jgi:hypothetical protein
MQKQLIQICSILCVTYLFVTACGKDSIKVKTKTELISQPSWKFEKAFAGGADITASAPVCLKDNILVFFANGTATVDEATSVCSPSYAGSYTWSFQSNETIIHLSAPLFPGGSNDFTLVSVTETNLVISQVMTIPPYPATNVEVTFKH